MIIYDKFDKDEEYEEIIKNVNDGYGCIIIDASCLVPTVNNIDHTKIEMTFAKKELTQFKLNHRYNNKGYVTASKTYGKKVSKIGYPFFYRIKDYINEYQNRFRVLFSLQIKLSKDEKSQKINLVVPVSVKITKDVNISVMSARFIVAADNQSRYEIFTVSQDRKTRRYSTARENNDWVYLGAAKRIENTYMFSEPVELFAMDEKSFEERFYYNNRKE